MLVGLVTEEFDHPGKAAYNHIFVPLTNVVKLIFANFHKGIESQHG